MTTNRTAFAGFLMTLGLASAASAETALTAVETAPVRTGPGTEYAIVNRVPAGQGYAGIVKVQSTSGDNWWKIAFDGRLLYTRADHWKVVDGAYGVKVVNDSLNVRKGPGTSYAIVGKVYAGQVYRYAAVSGAWYKVWWGAGAYYVWSGGLTKVSLAGTPTSGVTNLTMDWYVQVNNYFCGPTTTQIIAKYYTGIKMDVYTIAAFENTTSYGGTSSHAVCRGINYFGKPPTDYFVANTFDPARARLNIQRSTPVHINVKTVYLAYWNGATYRHHCTIKGFTSDGFYIHDSGKRNGADKWASTTEVVNAVNRLGGWYSVRF